MDSDHWAATVMLVGLSLVFLVSILYKAPGGDYFSICLFKNLTGLPCPGCGLTHSFCALGKGNVTQAFLYNELGPLLFLVALVVWARSIALLAGWRSLAGAVDSAISRIRLGKMTIVAFAVFGSARIAYILAYQPAVFTHAPLFQAIARLIG
ncbi:MAG TPA: DUF2752 domain-containing protein [Blastocatellia bacterium]|nr:DUF2752 domain-containing protein [Blastocatellia bacterium]